MAFFAVLVPLVTFVCGLLTSFLSAPRFDSTFFIGLTSSKVTAAAAF